MSDSTFAANHPESAARVVVLAHELGGDVQNAWDVLVAGVGAVAARVYVRASADAKPGVFVAIMAVVGVSAG